MGTKIDANMKANYLDPTLKGVHLMHLRKFKQVKALLTDEAAEQKELQSEAS